MQHSWSSIIVLIFLIAAPPCSSCPNADFDLQSGGKCYRLLNKQRTYPEAKSECLDLVASLAIFQTRVNFDTVTEYLSKHNNHDLCHKNLMLKDYSVAIYLKKGKKGW